jgi:hypothetical protein
VTTLSSLHGCTSSRESVHVSSTYDHLGTGTPFDPTT